MLEGEEERELGTEKRKGSTMERRKKYLVMIVKILTVESGHWWALVSRPTTTGMGLSEMGFDFLEFFPLFFLPNSMHRVRQGNCGMGLVCSQSVFEHDFFTCFFCWVPNKSWIKKLCLKERNSCLILQLSLPFLLLFDTLPFFYNGQ